MRPSRPSRASLRAVGRVSALALLGVLTAAGCGRAAAPGDDTGRPVPVAYDLDLAWAPASRVLAGRETVTVRNAGPGALPVVWLRLWANDAIPGQADGCRTRGTTLSRVTGATITRSAVACSAVALRLARPLPAGEQAVFGLRFRTRVPRDAALLGRRRGADLMGRAVPVLAVRDGAGWHLDPDTAVGDPAYTLSAAWHARIRAPDGVRVAATGSERSDTPDPAGGTHTLESDAPHARDFGLAAGPLRERSASAGGMRVRVRYALREDRMAAERALRTAILSVRRYTAWFGPAGPAELDVVLTRLGGGSQELPGLVFSDPDRATVAHEVAHQWWYGTVGDDQYRSPWLDESFASWSEEQLAPGTYPCRRSDPLGARRGQLTRGLAHWESRPRAYVDVVYRGGSCALRALEADLGRPRFLALLRAEVDGHRDGIVTTGDVMALVAAADPAVARRWARLVGLPTAHPGRVRIGGGPDGIGAAFRWDVLPVR